MAEYRADDGTSRAKEGTLTSVSSVAVLPMFPLGTVLLPHMYLPLHVFEPRYREMTQHCLAGEKEFGVVLIERGSEVGGGDRRHDVATVAHIIEAEQSPDGRWGLLCVGTRRLRVTQWLPDLSYPQAEVEDWDGGGAPSTPLDPLITRLRRALALAAEFGLAVAPATIEFDNDPEVALWQLCACAPIGPSDRYDLLRGVRPDDRGELLGRLLSDAIDVFQQRLAMG